MGAMTTNNDILLYHTLYYHNKVIIITLNLLYLQSLRLSQVWFEQLLFECLLSALMA